MLTTKANFAKVSGLNRQNMTPLTKKGGELFAAMCGGKLDTESDCAKAFLRKRGIDPSSAFDAPGVVGTGSQHKQRRPGSNRDLALDEIEQMTLAQVVDLFGTDQDFEKWTRARKTLGDIREKDLKNAKEEGQLVSRDLIKTGIIEPFDAAHIKMLTDGARTIASSVIELHRAGKEPAQIEEAVSKILGSFITPTKAKVGRVMKNI